MQQDIVGKVETSRKMIPHWLTFLPLLAVVLVSCRAQDPSTYCRLSTKHTLCRFQVSPCVMTTTVLSVLTQLASVQHEQDPSCCRK